MKKLWSIVLCAVFVAAVLPLGASAATYSVTYELTNMEASGPATLESGEYLFVTFEAGEGYMMPENIEVTGVAEGYEAKYGVGVTKLTGDLLLMEEGIGGDIVITAAAVKKCNVRFIGESWSALVPVPEGQALNEYYGSPDLTRNKDGYVFEGWFESADGGATLSAEPFDFDTVLSADVNLYPKWTAITTTTATETTVTEAVTTTTVIATTTTAAMVSPQTGHGDPTAAYALFAVLSLALMAIAARRLLAKAS